MGWSEDAARNRDLWTKTNAEYTDAHAARKWAQDEVTWGMWGAPESEIGVLGDLSGLDVVELGCGTAYMSAVFAKQGARPVGVDITPAQLETARRMMAETGIEFPLVEADAGDTGLADASFDLVFSEYGASIWVDPERWIAEAARILRTGGRLIFMCGSPVSEYCYSEEDDRVGETLVRPHSGLGRMEYPEGVEFHLAHGDQIRTLRRHGFEVEDLIELLAPDSAVNHPYYGYVTAEWGRRWPAEEVWAARKRA
jgi:SAM-dependent methyltransferase